MNNPHTDLYHHGAPPPLRPSQGTTPTYPLTASHRWKITSSEGASYQEPNELPYKSSLNKRSIESHPSSLQSQSVASQHGGRMKQQLHPPKESYKPLVPLPSASSDRLLPRPPRYQHELFKSPQETNGDETPKPHTYRSNDNNALLTQGSHDYIGSGHMKTIHVAPSERTYVGAIGVAMRGEATRLPSNTMMPLRGHLRRQGTGSTKSSPKPSIPTTQPIPISSHYELDVSTTSVAPSSATTTTSYDHRSLYAAYPSSGVPPTSNSPHCAISSLKPSPRLSISTGTPLRTQTRMLSSTAPRSRRGKWKLATTQSTLVCDCCPRKPRKFDTKEGLTAHAAERQFPCAHPGCSQRFLNDGVAGRHRRLFHVREFSWSCLPLSEFKRAFHESPKDLGKLDNCGYCSLVFLRSGKDAHGNGMATKDDWDERESHVKDMHDFGKCDGPKKYFRLDDFRRHLRDAHAAMRGSCTDELANTCEIKEDPWVPPSPT